MTLAPRLAGPDADLRHLPVALDFSALSVAEGIRAALSIAVLVAINEWAGIPALAEAALGAMLTCLCDPGGPIRQRIPAMLTFTLLASAITAGFGLLRGVGVLPAALVASAWIFCTMFARAWGAAPQQVGNLLTVVAVLALDRTPDLHGALVLGGMFAIGSVWALLLTLVIWRIHPFRPARRAVAGVYRRLAVLAADLASLLAQPGATPDLTSHARAHRRYVRDGIEDARTKVLDAIRSRGQSGARGNALLIQIESADQLFGAIIALSDVVEHGKPACRDAARPMLPALRLLLAAIADAIVAERNTVDTERALFEHLLAEIGRATDSPLGGIIHAIIERLRVAALLNTPEGETVEGGTPGQREPTLARLLRPLRTNLTWSSAALRHAIRAAAVALPALLITLSTGVVYAHWLTITLILTLQPFFALTWQRALERTAGTVLGGVGAALIAEFVHTPVAMAATLFPIAVIAFAVRRVSFGLFMAALTPLVVLLSELGQPGTTEFAIAAWRAGFTVAGGGMAVLGSLLLWPIWEPARVRADLQTTIQAHAAYADAEFACLLGEAATPPDTARRQAGIASNTLETSLSRALQEPKPSNRDEVRAAMLADAALRRIAGRLAAMQHEPGLAGAVDLPAWRAWLARAFAALETGDPLPPGPPPDAETGSLARIARQIALIAGALRPAEAVQEPSPSPRSPP